ncbi:MAG: hypothetical protein QW829_04005 [Candidatus Bathyarchaeia archaeon]
MRDGNEMFTGSKIIFEVSNTRKPIISLLEGEQKYDILTMPIAARLYLMQKERITTAEINYSYVLARENNLILGSKLQLENGFKCILNDSLRRVDEHVLQINRELRIISIGDVIGLRILTEFKTLLDTSSFHNFWYLAPPAFYKYNDLDHDGVPDWLGVKNFMIAEDKLTWRSILAYHNNSGICLSFIRADKPKYDSIPSGSRTTQHFICETDIGSLGWWENYENGSSRMSFLASYPYYEGEKSFSLSKSGEDWAAYVPINENKLISIMYYIRIKRLGDFYKGVIDLFHYLFKTLNPTVAELPFSLSDSIKYRTELLRKYYREWREGFRKKPAGFIIYFKPKDGKILANIIEFGFTGRNVLNAWCLMKEGYRRKNYDFVKKAEKIVDFFVKYCQSFKGLFYNLYNVDKRSPGFWWVGLYMPLNWIKEDEVEKYMGPVFKDPYLGLVISTLSKIKGCYLRSMCEDAYALLLCYETMRSHGKHKKNWIKAAIRFGDFLVSAQNKDGSWNRAYSLDGTEITEPKIWAGTDHERKGDTATAISFLIKLYKITGEKKYLDSAIRAGEFVLNNYVEPCEFCSGHPDSPYTKGTLITNEIVAHTLEAMLTLYEITKDRRYLEGAIKTGAIYATWIYLWDVPFPHGTTLHKYGFKSAGWGACDNCGAGYIHPFAIYNVRELLKLAELAKDNYFFKLAKLIAYNQQEMLASPFNMYEYACVGIQEEGRFTGWLLYDDPIWQDRIMGGGKKGEGNDTCLGWHTAVALAGLHKVLDEYGTLDFDAIYEDHIKTKNSN